jgi:hypothetical protein
MYLAISTVAIVAIAAAVVVVALAATVMYVLPRGGRRKLPPPRL